MKSHRPTSLYERLLSYFLFQNRTVSSPQQTRHAASLSLSLDNGSFCKNQRFARCPTNGDNWAEPDTSQPNRDRLLSSADRLGPSAPKLGPKGPFPPHQTPPQPTPHAKAPRQMTAGTPSRVAGERGGYPGLLEQLEHALLALVGLGEQGVRCLGKDRSRSQLGRFHREVSVFDAR